MKPERKLLNRMLFCACLLSSSVVCISSITAQEPEKTAPVPSVKEAKEQREYIVEKRLHAKEPDDRAPGPKVKDKMVFKKQGKPPVKVPFLGVVLGPVEESLGAQLGLPQGVGILVRAVMDDSPAAKAGVMQHDVLHYFNDQLLVNEPQLQTLVHQAGIGADARLTLFRKGKVENVTVKLGETLAREGSDRDRDAPIHFIGSIGKGPMGHGPGDIRWTAIAPYPENYDRELREFQERLQKAHGNAEEMRREIERFTNRMKDAAKIEAGKQKHTLNLENRDGADPNVRVLIMNDGQVGGGGVAAAISSATGKDGTTIISHNNVMVTKWKNEQGSGELKVENGRKHLTVRDTAGKETFSGPVDTAEQREKLSPEVREQLERIEKELKFEVRPLEAPVLAPPKSEGD